MGVVWFKISKATFPVAPDITTLVAEGPTATAVTPVLVIVTAPVAPDTPIPVPATLEVTPVLATVIAPFAPASVIHLQRF